MTIDEVISRLEDLRVQSPLGGGTPVVEIDSHGLDTLESVELISYSTADPYVELDFQQVA